MEALIFTETEVQKFPILNSAGDSYWQPTNNTVNGVYWLQLEAEKDCIDNGIEYTIGEIEIKQEDIV